MGVTGLWPVLEPCCQPVSLESLEGKKLAVDVSIWIYQAGTLVDTKAPHLALLLNRLCKLLFYKIKPVFVFDGQNVPVFKRKLLERRRKDEDALLDEEKRKQLKNYAAGIRNEEQTKKALTSPQKRLKQGDEAIFNLPSTSVEEIVISDDDAELTVEKVVDRGVMSKNSQIHRLMDLREQIRQSRLHPDSIPTRTEDFCNFQLSRVLGRNKIDKTIAKLTSEQQNQVMQADVKIAVADTRGGTHVISYDGGDDIRVVAHETGSSVETNWNSLGLTLDVFDTSQNVSRGSKESEEDLDFEDTIKLVERSGREFLSKSTMLEDLMKRRIGASQAEAIRQDEWSSDSGDDDFIDVSDGEVNFAGKKDEKEQSNEIVDRDWSPGPVDTTVKPVDVEKPTVRSLEERDRDPVAYRELQEFLTACGFPWIEAPGEAEAQCVELERLGLVEGIVSDDSDVWPFGAQKVYRHFFAKNKNIQYYSQENIRNITSLTQPQFIEIAMIAGGDYSQGISGAGIVTAIEIIAEFSTFRNINEERKDVINTMSTLEDWILNKAKEGGESHTMRRKIRTLIEKNNIVTELEGLSNPEIIDAYLRPNVDRSREPLRWKRIDIDNLKNVVTKLLDWTDEKFDKIALPCFQKWNDFITGAASYQKHITSYVLSQSVDEQKVSMTKRVAEALQRLRKKLVPEPPSLICQATFEDSGTAPSSKARKPRKPTNGKRNGRRAKRSRTDAQPGRSLNLSESSDNEQ